MTTPAIHVAGLTKSYGDHHVLRGVDLDVARGTILALLGSNGAGKTTTVRILATLLRTEAGRPSSTGTTSPRRPTGCAARSV
jgi:ABC-2 type transport system ATP-binding protein